MKTDVLIIGAGPTGLSLANQLMRFGVDFVIVDKNEGITGLSKALVVHARSMEIYDQLGIAERALELGQVMNKIRLLQGGEVRAEVPVSDIGKGLSPFPFALILEQSKNEEILYENLVKQGKEVGWQCEIEGLSQDSDGVAASLKSAVNGPFEIEAKYLVGCDGASSYTRRLLDIGFEGSTFPRLFYVADVEMECGLPRNNFSGTFHGDSFLLLMPMKGENHWRLIGNLPDDENGDGEISFEEIERKVKEVSQIPLEIGKIKWFSSYKVHTRHAEVFSKGRCFLAGDAAHVHTPAGGQGMNTGIQDAYNLAWKLAFAIRGLAGNKLLDTYSEERLANAIRLLRTTDQAFELATNDEWVIRFFRENIFPSLAKFALQFDIVKEFIFPTISQIGISYAGHSLSRNDTDIKCKIKAGERVPYFELNGKNFYDYLKGPKFHLVNFEDGAEHISMPDEIKARFYGMLDFQTFPLYPQIAGIFGIQGSFSILIRPDNYISFITGKEPSGELENYFGEILNA